MKELIDELVRVAAQRSFRPVMTNVMRSTYVEVMIDKALGPDWRLTGDWDGWDFEHADGTRLEIKQSASLQAWRQKGPSVPSFDIGARKGRFVDDGVGYVWQEGAGRNAHIYVFAHHDVYDEAECNQLDPAQWDFYVVPSNHLPDQATARLATIKKCGAQKCAYGELAEVVTRVANSVEPCPKVTS